MNSVKDALERFFDKAREKYDHFYDLHEEQNRSPCEVGGAFRFNNQSVVEWYPLARQGQSDLAGLSDELHADIRQYYESFWSGHFEASCIEGPVSLIQVWNRADIDRLKENMIGHLIAKKTMHLPLTGFFATTSSESDYILSVDSSSGMVVLEKPGYRVERQVAKTLAEFIDRLDPTDPWLSPSRKSLSKLW